MADLLDEDDNTYTVKGPGGKAVKIPKSTANAVGYNPQSLMHDYRQAMPGQAPQAQPTKAPAQADTSGFVGYVRDVPAKMNQTWADEINRIQKLPGVGEWFQQHMPNASPAQRMDMIQKQAAENAQTLTHREIGAARQKYGVKNFTQDDFKAMLDQENTKKTADTGKDVGSPIVSRSTPQQDAKALAGKNYDADLHSVQMQDSANEYQRLQGYLPFDAPPPPPQSAMPTRPPPLVQPMRTPPVQQTPAAMSVPGGSTFTGAPSATPSPPPAPAPAPAGGGGPAGAARMYQPGTENT